jgi:hypothetical protein
MRSQAGARHCADIRGAFSDDSGRGAATAIPEPTPREATGATAPLSSWISDAQLEQLAQWAARLPRMKEWTA